MKLSNKCVDAVNETLHGSCSRNVSVLLSFPGTTIIRLQTGIEEYFKDLPKSQNWEEK